MNSLPCRYGFTNGRCLPTWPYLDPHSYLDPRNPYTLYSALCLELAKPVPAPGPLYLLSPCAWNGLLLALLDLSSNVILAEEASLAPS